MEISKCVSGIEKSAYGIGTVCEWKGGRANLGCGEIHMPAQLRKKIHPEAIPYASPILMPFSLPYLS
jgi:hypothetical protein